MNVAKCQYLSNHGWQSPLPLDFDSKQTVVFIFGSPELGEKRELFQHIRSSFPQSQLIGCSTSGEIYGEAIFDNSLSIAVMQLQSTEIRMATKDIDSADQSIQVGRDLALGLKAEGLKGVFVLSDGLRVNGSQLMEGVREVLGPEVSVSGGLAGDGPNFQKTWTLREGMPTEGVVTAIGFYGAHIQIGTGSFGGWDVFGPIRKVTKSQDNVLYELDHRPALELYKEYLGEFASELPSSALMFPLSIVDAGHGAQKDVVRTVLSVDEKDSSMTFAGDIPQEANVQLMQANFERLVAGAKQAAMFATKAENDGKAHLAIAISCVGRRLVLGEHTEDETEAALEVLPDGTSQVGFYSYGEIAPGASGRCELHNQTMTLTLFTE